MLVETVEELQLHVAGAHTSVATRLRRSSGNWVFLLHGLGCTKESFDDAFGSGAFAGYSICAIDFPGHGASVRLADDADTLSAYARIVEQVAAQLAPERLFLVGHSMGGAVGLIAAPRLPRLDGFVSVEGNLVAADCGLVSRRAAEQSADEFAGEGFESFVAGLRQVRTRDHEIWADWCEAGDPRAIHGAARSLVKWSDSGDLLRRFLALPQRAYCHGAEGDDRVSHLFPLLTGVPRHRISHSGHFPMIDNPQDLYRTLASILADAAAD